MTAIVFDAISHGVGTNTPECPLEGGIWENLIDGINGKLSILWPFKLDLNLKGWVPAIRTCQQDLCVLRRTIYLQKSGSLSDEDRVLLMGIRTDRTVPKNIESERYTTTQAYPTVPQLSESWDIKGLKNSALRYLRPFDESIQLIGRELAETLIDGLSVLAGFSNIKEPQVLPDEDGAFALVWHSQSKNKSMVFTPYFDEDASFDLLVSGDGKGITLEDPCVGKIKEVFDWFLYNSPLIELK